MKVIVGCAKVDTPLQHVFNLSGLVRQVKT